MDTIGFTIIYLGYAAFMLLVYRHSGVLRDLLIYQIVAKIGVHSYGIYLWHLAVRDWCAHFALRFGPALQWPAAIVTQYSTAIVLGTMLTLLIEWPSLRLRDRLFPAKGNSAFAHRFAGRFKCVDGRRRANQKLTHFGRSRRCELNWIA